VKICSKCNRLLPDDSFAWRKINVSRQSSCKECKTKYNRLWYEANAETHKASVAANNLTYKARYNELVSELKNVPCADCKGRFPTVAMDFDHLRDKEYDVAKMKRHSFEKLLIEISKCEVVCSNCHRIRTAQRRK
jgi:hypothetical protein